MILLLPVILAFLFGTIIFVSMFNQFFFLVYEHEAKSLPSGSMGFPFVGEAFGFFTSHKSFSIGSFLKEHRSRYGKVFKSYIFGSPTIVSCDLELNKFVLQNEGKLFQNSYPKPIRDILGKYSLMIVTDVELHKKLRSIELGLINKFKCTPNFLCDVDKLCVSLMESWRGNQLVLFAKQAKQFSFNLMLMNLLGMKPGEPLGLQLLEDFLTFMKGFVSIPVNLPWTPYAKAVKAHSRISSTLKQVIKDRAHRKDVEVLNSSAKENHFDEILLKGALSDVEKVSIIQDLLLAGYETTSGLLSLLVYFLAKSPKALQNLKDEHRALRRKKKEGEPLNWEDYKQMEFTIMVINETLRCGNLVKFVHKKAIKNVEFKGYHIPAGWKVLPILSAVHLDPSLHENPSEFNPWRWTDPATSKKVIPFGGGMRLCPGSELGKLEAAFFLHHLVLNYRWTMKEDHDYPMLYPYMDFPRGLLIALEAETTEF